MGRAVRPDLAEWGTASKTNAILADIYDVLAMINANLVALGSGKKAKIPKDYPRPGVEEKKDTEHFGSEGLPLDELKAWLENKRANNG